ncbi:MAG TPA: polyketide synthase, partial [Anaerolineales bacterium]|nr:polyketide synthase [Anaerolineales bacterium]
MIDKAIAVVGVGAVMPDAENAAQFWQNILTRRDSIREVPAYRWSAEMYYNPDPSIPDKTYSKIGSWVEDFNFNPFKWGIMIPPRVLDNMDDSQKWAIAASHEALSDYGYPDRELPTDRVAVIFGNAMAGEKHYKTNLRIHAPQFGHALSNLPEFQALPPAQQKSLMDGMLNTIYEKFPPINEDTMPGELGNIIAGRVANVFNFGGANYVTDAACASSMAALQAAVDGLASHQFDAVLTGGIDRNNGAGSFVKFSKIGALSPDGSRPYADGANGFVMGEGAAVFLLKRLEDAERDDDKIYAVIRGIGSSSDGKGKGITAPNPIGQQRALERAWQRAGVNPASVGLIEGHGTSTRVGDR